MPTTGTSTTNEAVAATTKGDFLARPEGAWRNWISRDENAKFPPEKDRYHLYVSYGCPFAHRTLIVRALKGLEHVISVTAVHPTWRRTKPEDANDSHTGWVFADPHGEPYTNTIGLGGPFPAHLEGLEPDPLYHSYSIRDLYERAANGSDIQETKCSVPILWDKKLGTIVSNESAEIIRMFNSEFNEFAKNPDLDLYPTELQKDIDAVNSWIAPSLNTGVYRCGFATSQKAYDTALDEVTASFDRINQILQTQRYLVGDQFTEADVRLFVSLLRFDEVYAVYFKINNKSVTHTPALLNYCREIYQMPGVAQTIKMDQMKMAYYTSRPDCNRWSIIPRGTQFEDLLKQPHGRIQNKPPMN